jgi:recombinational DNA repair ATPase RecF
MRLLSLNVRNYRIHRDLTLDFDPSRNLIGGSNETGKSTLAEAIHRALFMRHRAGGELRNSMKSLVHSGDPEVRLTFETGGETWTVEKRFAGTQGTARLSSAGGVSLQGDAAEDKLAEIIGNSAGVANRLNDLTTRWAHLWVWQGTAGQDASAHAAAYRADLVQRLQQDGLAAIMQSAIDEQIRSKLAADFLQIFNNNGSPKANSPLHRANSIVGEAQIALTRAQEQQQRLAAAVADQEEATATVNAAMAALPGQRTQLAAAHQSLAQAKELGARIENEQLVLKSAQDAHDQLAKADQQIRELRAQAAATRDSLVPAEAKLSLVADQESTSRVAASQAELAHRAVNEALRLARQHHDLATACVARFEKSAAHQSLAAKAAEIAQIRSTLASDHEALSKLPAIDAKQLDALRQLESSAAQAESALNAIAAGIELVASTQTVLLDGQPLATGQPRVITEPAELRLGDGTLLRIQPGGGNSLASARRQLTELQDQFAAALDRLAIPSLADAAEAVAARQVIEQRIANTESKLQALGARELPDALAAATAALTAASTEVDQRLAVLPTGQAPPLPQDLGAAQLWQREARAAFQAEETRERTLQAEADARRTSHQQHAQDLQTQRDALEAGRRTLADQENSARILEQNHGEAPQRAAALEAAVKAADTARSAVETTRAALAELNPGALQRELERLQRVLEQTELKQRDAETRLAVARATLALDGSTDPDAELLQAKVRHALATEAKDREQRHSDSIRLLHSLFQESQSAISESVTQPVADRVTGYLECLFGRGVRVKVDLANPASASLELTRPDTPSFSFDSLSGGAKEQVATAVRLATAEILAANHDRCLPLVLDDAFAYADNDRIQALQSMLDLAAARDLQVIVLTCTPDQYTGLGARDTRLKPHLWKGNQALPALPSTDEDDEDEPEDDNPAQAAYTAPAGISIPLSDEAEASLLAALRSLGGRAGNLSLRTALGWDDTSYKQVRASLVAKSLVTTGPGRGGSVILT